MKIAISGINGFIGNAIKERFKGDNVIGIDKSMLLDESALKQLLINEKPHIIFHCASYGNHYDQKSDYQTIMTNVLGTYNMLSASLYVPYIKFYNFSTSSVTLDVETFYSASKKSSEAIANAFKTKYDKPIVNIRPYSVYGEGEADFRFIPKVIKSLVFGEKMNVDENATHDWIYIQDFIDGLLDGYTEIGTGIKTTNIEIIRILENISGKKLRYTKSHLRNYDNNNWVCKNGVKHISIEEGLEKTYRYYEQRFKG
jgi:nucleoside-diphosphate-sugar epimerase